MASSSFKLQGIDFIKEIQDSLNKRDYANMNININHFTRFLFDSKDLIYSELNDEFERSNLMINLFACMNVVNEQCRRDILRLLNIFLKTNRNLRIQTTANENCLQILLNILKDKNKWDNLDKIKYYVNLSSYLLIKKETRVDTEEIRKLIKQILIEMDDEDETVILRKINLMMLHCAAEINAGLNSNEIQQNNDGILTKGVIDTFEEWIRDYLHDFKVFYEHSETNKSRFDKYNLKIEYGFDQICQCLVYYAQTSEKIRMTVFQSGLYEILDLILLLNSVPEHFMLNVIKAFEIPCLDSILKERFLQEYSTIIDRLKKVQLKSNGKIKENIENLLNKYNNPKSLISATCANNSMLQKKSLVTLPNPTSKSFPGGIKNWGEMDVDQWLLENNLKSCRQSMSSLTGRGLNQLKKLTKENDGKFHLIELLMSKLNLDLVAVLEFLGALESLVCD